ncbi:MAG: TetR/AcrR family transcriptional regulator [Thermodesulfobacteriota bacterium]|nr:TetR/AcrR family transcriptional regulator [Thermodesulfobacteriota bacterium]
MTTRNLSRKEREKQRQRQDIIDAGLELFSEKGYHNVAMQEIAEKAEFAVGTIYNFFPTKADLYETIVRQKIDLFEQAFEKAIQTATDEIDQLRNYIRAKSETFRSNISFVRLMVAESRGVSFSIKGGLTREMRNRYYRFLERIACIFENGIRHKRFKPIASAFQLAAALDSTVNTFLLLWVEMPGIHPFPEDPDIILNIFFHSLLDTT